MGRNGGSSDGSHDSELHQKIIQMIKDAGPQGIMKGDITSALKLTSGSFESALNPLDLIATEDVYVPRARGKGRKKLGVRLFYCDKNFYDRYKEVKNEGSNS